VSGVSGETGLCLSEAGVSMSFKGSSSVCSTEEYGCQGVSVRSESICEVRGRTGSVHKSGDSELDDAIVFQLNYNAQ
jgi:hypothetical protein